MVTAKRGEKLVQSALENAMIFFAAEDCRRGMQPALQQYHLITRRPPVVVTPFEVNEFEAAMRKVLDVIRSTMVDRPRSESLLGDLLFNLSAWVHAIRLHLRAIANDFGCTLRAHSAGARPISSIAPPIGSSLGMGFFSAAKPNLRNAP